MEPATILTILCLVRPTLLTRGSLLLPMVVGLETLCPEVCHPTVRILDMSPHCHLRGDDISDDLYSHKDAI